MSGKGGKGGYGKGDSGGRDTAAAQRSGGEFKPKVFTFKAGQFEDADLEGKGGTTEDAVDAIIDATFESPDGLLVFDYHATDAENAKVAEKFDQSNPRSIEALLGYAGLDEALGAERAATAPDFLHDAWAVAASNPYITHEQRVGVATHLDKHLRDIVDGDRGYLEYALTPPEDWVG